MDNQFNNIPEDKGSDDTFEKDNSYQDPNAYQDSGSYQNGNYYQNGNQNQNMYQNNGNPYQNGNGYGYQQYQQPNYGYNPNYNGNNMNNGMDESPMTMGDWVLTLLALMIPCAGIVLYFVWAFGSRGNINRRNFCRAQLAILGVVVVLYLVLILILGVSFAGAMSSTY